MSGLMSLTGEPEGHPVKMGISISDLATGVWAANGVQAALLMRARTGRGLAEARLASFEGVQAAQTIMKKVTPNSKLVEYSTGIMAKQN